MNNKKYGFKIILLHIRFYLLYYYSKIFNRKIRIQNRDPKSIPIIIISYNQLFFLKKLLLFLKKNGYHNIIILDNNSTYPPLIEFFNEIDKELIVIRMKKNYGHRVLWKNKDCSLRIHLFYYPGEILL